MSNIVDNLTDHIRAGFDPHKQLKEARREIKRLNAEIARLQGVLRFWQEEFAKQLSDRLDERDEARTQVVALREALEQIASGGLFQHAHEFARAALAEKEEK